MRTLDLYFAHNCEANPRTVQSNLRNHPVFEHKRNTFFSFEAVAVSSPISKTCVNRVGGKSVVSLSKIYIDVPVFPF